MKILTIKTLEDTGVEEHASSRFVDIIAAIDHRCRVVQDISIVLATLGISKPIPACLSQHPKKLIFYESGGDGNLPIKHGSILVELGSGTECEAERQHDAGEKEGLHGGVQDERVSVQ